MSQKTGKSQYMKGFEREKKVLHQDQWQTQDLTNLHPALGVPFSCSAHKEYYRLHLVGLAATTLWGKGKLTCHAADVHQPPLVFSKKRQKFLRDFHGPKEVHGHASFVFGHGNEFPFGWKAKDSGIVDQSPQS